MKPTVMTAPAPPDNGLVNAKWWLGLERRWWILVAIGTGSFMAGLDGSVVNTVLPVIRASFGADLPTVEWVVLIYLLTLSTLLLTFGRLGDMVGHKRIYNVGFIVFTVGSALCSLSATEAMLISFRAFQALGAAMITSNAAAILTRSFPAQQRGQVLGMQAAMVYLGVMVGPSLGGLLAEYLGWRAIFYVNVPIGLLGTALAFVIIPRAEQRRRESFDLAGAGALAVGLGALMLALSKGQELTWTSPFIVSLLAVAVGGLAAFLVVERVVRHPMLDLTLFRDRLFSAATFCAFINYVCVFTAMFLVPFYLLEGRHFSPAFAGMLLTSQPLVMVVVAPISGLLSDRVHSRVLSTLGMAALAAGLLSLSALGPQTGELEIVWRLMLIGFGAGMFNTPNNSAILGSVPLHRRGVATGVVSTARNMGMVFGIAAAGAVFNAQLAARTALYADSRLAFFGAMQDTFLAAAALAAIGAALSLVRGSAQPNGAEALGTAPGDSDR